jgi:hypothetical protein
MERRIFFTQYITLDKIVPGEDAQRPSRPLAVAIGMPRGLP